MGLRDLIPRATIKLSDGGEGLSVRGFSPRDGVLLYQRHTGDLAALYDEFAGRVQDGARLTAADVGGAMVGGAPVILAEIIALAADFKPDQPDWDETIAALLDFPAGAQVDALTKIGDLTFTSEMPPKKFFGLVLTLAASAQAKLPASGQPDLPTSEPGSGD